VQAFPFYQLFLSWTFRRKSATIASKFLRKGDIVTENFLVSLNTVLPLFLSIGIGILARHRSWISTAAAREANGLCFKVFVSTLLFYNIYTADLKSALSPRLLTLCLICILLEFTLGMLLMPRIEAANPARGVLIQSCFRTNCILMGIPIATSLYGAGQIGPVAVLSPFASMFFNILAVITLELFRRNTPDPKKILRGIATNPLIIAAVLGVVCNLAGLRLTGFAESTVSSIAKAASPMSLVLMGASLNFGRMKQMGRNLLLSCLLRLAVFPAVFVSAAAALGLRGSALCTVLVIFATPVAVNSYTMALQMDGDADLAGGVILSTTAVSCVTLFLWIWLLKSLGLL